MRSIYKWKHFQTFCCMLSSPHRFIALLCIRTCAHQGVRNVRLSENLACFVFLKQPFWDLPFCLVMDHISVFLGTDFSFFGQKKDLSGDNSYLFRTIFALCLVCLCNWLISLTLCKLFSRSVLFVTLRVVFYVNPRLKYWSIYKFSISSIEFMAS